MPVYCFPLRYQPGSQQLCSPVNDQLRRVSGKVMLVEVPSCAVVRSDILAIGPVTDIMRPKELRGNQHGRVMFTIELLSSRYDRLNFGNDGYVVSMIRYNRTTRRVPSVKYAMMTDTLASFLSKQLGTSSDEEYDALAVGPAAAREVDVDPDAVVDLVDAEAPVIDDGYADAIFAAVLGPRIAPLPALPPVPVAPPAAVNAPLRRMNCRYFEGVEHEDLSDVSP